MNLIRKVNLKQANVATLNLNMLDNSVLTTLAKCALAFDNNAVSKLVYESLLCPLLDP